MGWLDLLGDDLLCRLVDGHHLLPHHLDGSDAQSPAGAAVGQALKVGDGLDGDVPQPNLLQEGLDADCLVDHIGPYRLLHQRLVGEHRGLLQPDEVGPTGEDLGGTIGRRLHHGLERGELEGTQIQFSFRFQGLLGDVGLLEALLEDVAGLVRVGQVGPGAGWGPQNVIF